MNDRQTQKEIIEENQAMLKDWMEESRCENLIGFYFAAYDRDGNIKIFRNSTSDTEKLVLSLRNIQTKLDIDNN